MTHTIFFSWQLDTQPTEGRNLIERALKSAIAKVVADVALEEAVRDLAVDKDTQNVPGSPPLVETILKKIDAAAIFVPDLTLVGKRQDGRPTPNPNVLIEYGYALKSLGHGRLLPVMNTAHGAPSSETLPFDLQHVRHPIKYTCPDGAVEAERSKARDDLAKSLANAIRLILKSSEFKDANLGFRKQEDYDRQVKQRALAIVRAAHAAAKQHSGGGSVFVGYKIPLNDELDVEAAFSLYGDSRVRSINVDESAGVANVWVNRTEIPDEFLLPQKDRDDWPFS